ncbi:regulator of chromosome condensation 1/beta-lactamase-inhibitor protein II [Melampsora americana]|nr:regulator of chromosome condensation 1/beta-lactamase-inhibitor protein II [Melampsora americana]
MVNSSLVSLPLDLLLDSIFPYLSIKDLLSLAVTCKPFEKLIQSTETIWRARVETDYRFPVAATGRVDGFKTLYRKLSKPQVWVWGQSRNSRLGLDGVEKLFEKAMIGFDNVPTPVRLEAVESKALIDLQAGGWSFHGLTVDGHIWCWGTMDGTFSGRGIPWNTAVHGAGESRPKPKLLEIIGMPTFRSISCGRQHVLALTDEGQLYEWYSWMRLTRLISTPWKRLSQISAGWNFSAVLTHSGEVYVWRKALMEEVKDNLNLQEIRKDMADEVIEFDLRTTDRYIRCPTLSEQIVKIATGEDFIICLTDKGKVYKLDLSLPNLAAPPPHLRQHSTISDEERFRSTMRGSFLDQSRTWIYLPKFCEPGPLNSSLSTALPNHCPNPNSTPRITHISAQFRSFVSYSVTTDPNGDSFVFLGKKDAGIEDEPEVIPTLQKRGVIQISLGDHHFLALLSNGQLLSWGSYSAGALGLGHPRRPHKALVQEISESDTYDLLDKPTPTLLQSFSGSDGRWERDDAGMKRRYVFAATAAGWHSGCLAFGIDEDEDEDLGLGVIDEDRSDEETGFTRQPILNPNGRVRFRIGYPGRFMRGNGRGRGGVDHQGFSQDDVGT